MRVSDHYASAAAHDAADPLAHFRSRFQLPDGVIYLDGNSLGALPTATAQRVANAVTGEWGEGLVRSWNSAGWIDAPRRVGGKIARLLGVADDEVVVADSTSVNLYKLLGALLQAQGGQGLILTEPGNFPTDLYIAQGLSACWPGVSVRTVPRGNVIEAVAPGNVVLLTHVHYRTGERFDIAATERAVAERGGKVVWDLSHSAGALRLELGGAGAKFAVGCGYKYLNGGPGAPAYLYAAREWQTRLRSPLTGWMGHTAPFAFSDDYAPADGMARFMCGTPPILSLTALEVGVDLMLEADLTAVEAKGQALCDAFITGVEALCGGVVNLITPRQPDLRGSHVSLAHPQAYAVMQALIARGVIGDFREPDALRFGMTPLYTRFADVAQAADILAQVLASGEWADPRFSRRLTVT